MGYILGGGSNFRISACRLLITRFLYAGFYYAHTNRFCVVQENIKPEVLEVQTELARFVHKDRWLYIFLYNDKTG